MIAKEKVICYEICLEQLTLIKEEELEPVYIIHKGENQELQHQLICWICTTNIQNNENQLSNYFCEKCLQIWKDAKGNPILN